MIKICDEPKARTRRKTFHYIREENILRHISKYAESQIKEGDEKAYTVTYNVQKEKLKGKQSYEFTFTNSGGFIVWKYPAELVEEKDKNLEDVSIEELHKLRFEVESDETSGCLLEEDRFYIPMVHEINEFKARMGMDYILASDRVSDYFKDVKRGEVSCLCNYPETSRQNSLEQTFKYLHQWWALKLVHEALGAVKVERGWSVTQGEPYPVSIFVDIQGNHYTCWFEPQLIGPAPPNYSGPLTSFFEERVVWKRPDLLISKGRYGNIKEPCEFDILIECKNLPFDKWWMKGTVIENQLSPYKQLFDPKTLIVVSLEPIPDWAKRELENQGFLIVDEVYPGGKGVHELANILRKYFGF